jgi:phosphatidylglycerophosphate synthase
VLSAAADIYRRTRKPNDIIWNRLVARPLAAVLVVPLARTGITPNQVTFVTLPVFLAGAAVLALLPSWGALVAGAAIIEFSYVLDCADGQLARLKGTSSPVGAHLDFLMDELKAFALVAAIAVRLWLPARDPFWLLEGLAGLVAVAGAISLTTFVRRPEYAAATGATVSQGTGDYGEGSRRRRRRRAALHSRGRGGRPLHRPLPEPHLAGRAGQSYGLFCTPTGHERRLCGARAAGIMRSLGRKR